MSVRYDVEVRYLTSGSIDKPLRKAQSDMAGFGRSVGNIFDVAMGSAIASLGMKIGETMLAGVKYAVAGIHSELEETGIALATIFGARGVSKNLTDGLQMSSAVMKMMMDDAAKLPGEFKDLVGIFQSISSSGLMSGMSVREVEKFSAKTMAIAAIAKVPFEVASREMAAMLEGNVRQQNIMYRRLFASVGSPKELNAMSPEKRRKAIEGEMNKPAFAEAMKAYESTFTARISTIRQKLKYDLLVPMTQGLFGSVKDTMGRFIDWFDAHGPQITSWAQRVGEHLKHGFEYAVEKGTQLVGIAAKIAEHMNGVHLTGAGLALAAPAALGAAGSAGSGIAEMLGIAGAAEGIAALAAGIAILGTVAVGAQGAFNDITNSLSNFHEEARMRWEDITSKFADGLQKLGSAYELLKPALQSIADVAGNQVLRTLQGLTSAFDLLATGIESLAWHAREAYKALASVAGSTPWAKFMGYGSETPGERSDLSKLYNSGYEHPNKRAGAISDGKLTETFEDLLGRKSPDSLKPPVHNTTIHKVEIVVNSNQDPSRIARLTAEELVRLARNRTSSNVQNWSVHRPR
jgi:hypothetical protein